LERVRSRWQAEVDELPEALLGLSVEACFDRERTADWLATYSAFCD
jgi:hypothetical protein